MLNESWQEDLKRVGHGIFGMFWSRKGESYTINPPLHYDNFMFQIYNTLRA